MKTKFIILVGMYNSLEEGTEIRTKEAALALAKEVAEEDEANEATIIEVASVTNYDVETTTTTTLTEKK